MPNHLLPRAIPYPPDRDGPVTTDFPMTQRLREAFLAWTEREQDPHSTGRRRANPLFGLVSWPMSGLYRLGVGLDRAIRHRAPRELPNGATLAVVASPLVGGVGKTPLVARLANDAQAAGKRLAIVVRGYGRATGADEVVRADPDGSNIDVVGDEAIVLAQESGAPVYVGADPHAAIQHVVAQTSPDIVVLDDGVRHRWQGERRIITLTAADLHHSPCYLPYGRWRIPPAHALPAAGVAVIESGQGAGTENARKQQQQRVKSFGYDLPIGWYQARSLGILRWSNGTFVDEGEVPASSPLVFCGIGQPSRFLRQLQSIGLDPPTARWFADHYRYTKSNVAALVCEARQAGAEWLLTTHKDAVKIQDGWLDGFPLYVLRISLELTAGTDMLSVILESPA